MRNALRRMVIRVLEAVYPKPPEEWPPQVYRLTIEKLDDMTPDDAQREIARLSQELDAAREAAYYATQLGIDARRRKPSNGDA